MKETCDKFVKAAFVVAIIAGTSTAAVNPAAAADFNKKSFWEWVIEGFASEGGLGTTRYR